MLSKYEHHQWKEEHFCTCIDSRRPSNLRCFLTLTLPLFQVNLLVGYIYTCRFHVLLHIPDVHLASNNGQYKNLCIAYKVVPNFALGLELVWEDRKGEDHLYTKQAPPGVCPFCRLGVCIPSCSMEEVGKYNNLGGLSPYGYLIVFQILVKYSKRVGFSFINSSFFFLVPERNVMR